MWRCAHSFVHSATFMTSTQAPHSLTPCRGGGAPGIPDLGAELSAIGYWQAPGARPGADLGGRRRGRGGRQVETGLPGGRFSGGGHDAPERVFLGFGPGTSGGEEAVGPFLGELPGLAEDDRHVRPADLDFRQAVGDQRGPDPAAPRLSACDHVRAE